MMMNLPCLMGSCPNFLRTIYHTPSASQAPRQGHALWKIPMPATALVFVWLLLTGNILAGTDLLSGRYANICFAWSLYWCSSLTNSIVYGLLFQNPAQPADLSPARQGSGTLFLFYAATCTVVLSGYLISLSIFFGSYRFPVFRMVYITRSILQAITISDCIFFSGLFSLVV